MIYLECGPDMQIFFSDIQKVSGIASTRTIKYCLKVPLKFEKSLIMFEVLPVRHKGEPYCILALLIKSDNKV